MRQPVKAETSSQSACLEFTRYDVLSRLWKNAEWLNDKIHLKQLKVNGALRQRVYMVQVQSGVCKVILSGLKDEELEQRVKALEDLIENGVVIPGEQKSKK